MNNEISWFLTITSTSIADVIICYTFFNELPEFSIRLNKKFVYLIIMLISSINITFSEIVKQPIINLIFACSTYSFMGYLIFNGNKHSKIFYAFLEVSIGAGIELLSGICLSAFFQVSIDKISNNLVFHIMGAFVSKLLLFLTIKCIVRIRKARIEYIPLKLWGVLIIIPIESTFIIIHELSSYLYCDTIRSIEPVITVIGVLYINIIAFTLFEGIVRQSELNRRHELANYHLRLQEAHYKEIIEKNMETRATFHDMKNHFISIYYLVTKKQYNLVKDYIEKLNYKLDNSTETVITGNLVLDSILENKKALANDNGINVEIDSFVKRSINIDPVDICIIVGNAIDNAIEACNKINDKGLHKKVEVTLKNNNDYFIISVTNPFVEKPTYINGVFLSQKKEDISLHGFGLFNIEQAVKKYDGNVSVMLDDNLFKLNIVLLLSR